MNFIPIILLLLPVYEFIIPVYGCYEKCYMTSVAVIPKQDSLFVFNGVIEISSDAFYFERYHQLLQSFHPMIFNINARGEIHSIMNNLSTPIKLFWSGLNAGKESAIQVDHIVVSEMEISEYQILSTRNIFYFPRDPKIMNQKSGLFYRQPNFDSFQKICTWNAIIDFSNPKMKYEFNHFGTFNLEINKEEASFEYVNVKMKSEEKLWLTLPGLEYEPDNEISVGYYDGNAERDMAISVFNVTLLNKCEGRTGIYERKIVYETPNYGKIFKDANIPCREHWTCREGLVDQRRNMKLVNVSDIDSFIPKATVAPPVDNCDDPDCDFDHGHSSASHLIASVFLNLLMSIVFYVE